ncbi:TIM-barrel domain-containing protein [Paenibacillus sp. L3-i20]|uniref:TIM-barrel domain-containing protein n=1 Tax=Paenibacillus sp. L3-i20 TaxID=2905833 RepID=UPI001EDF6E63|nr:TIM-barrel domain-containing protein [Paenibacillus sp. L3-i20]GKU76494.1 glycosyl hydrolase family 31 [Paenibacillus sp. L3-i20]
MSIPSRIRGKRLAIYGIIIALLCSTFLSVPVVPVSAFVPALGNVTAFSASADTLTLTVDNGAEPNDDILIFNVLQNDIVKVSYRPNNVAPSNDTPMIDPNKTWSTVGATINTASNPITITTSKMSVEITKTPTRVTIKKADGTTLLWEPAGGGIFSDGVRFQHASGHNIYGIRSYNANEDAPDLIRNNNSHPAHAGNQGDSGGPLMWSTAGYGILVDSDGGYPYTDDASGKLEFYYGGTPVEGRRYSKTDVEYYAIVGNPKEIMSGVAEITGKSPLLPKWSLGFMNFEWGMDQTELATMTDTYRAKNIPLDAYGLDYDWKKYGETAYGEFAWNTHNFPSAAGTALKTHMDAKGVKLIGITKPRIVTMDARGNRTSQYNDANSGGYWYPGHSEYSDYFIPVLVRSIDPYNSAMRAWYWDHSKDAYDKGIVGWWNDETDKVASGSAQWWFGNFSTTHLSQAMYEGQRAYTSGAQRVWQTARTFYPGAQRYATTLWSGDIGAQFYKGEKVSWASGMQEQRTVMLSSIAMGQPKWGMDAGGFNPSDSNPSPELYARWLQFSALTPVFRVHGNLQHQRQPWYYGNTAEEAAKGAIQLRYSLIPYMYTYERSALENGNGLVRPLLFDYPNDAAASNYTEAWMFGDYLLAAPIVDQSQTTKNIYLPAGTWTDYFRGITYAGGQNITYPVNAETWSDIPLFIKKGAIIPSQKTQDYIGQSAVSKVNVDVFPDTTATSFTYYEDDGTSYDYEGGEHFKQTFTAQDNGGSGVTVGIAAKSGVYTPEVQSYIVKVHGKAGTAVTSNGTSLTSYGDLNALQAASGEGWTTGRDIYGLVTYVKVTAASTSAKTIVVTGNGTVAATSVKLEAEEASLSGNTIGTKAKVNNNHAGYTGTGFIDGLDQAGAGATFYADVKTGGDYTLDLRYANATGSAKTISIYVNGKRVKSTNLPSLVNWSTWSTKSESVPLAAGRNAITYKYDNNAGDTGSVNVDYITVPFAPTASKYEAESAERSGGAATNKNHKFYTGEAFVDALTTVGAQVKFNVDVPSAGNYSVALRYANGSGSTKTLSTYVNGVDVAQVSLTSPGTSWDTWQDATQTLALNAGSNTIAFRYDSADTGNANVDRLLVSSSAPGTPESERNLLDNGDFERETGYGSAWTEWHPSGQALAYGIDSGSGTNPPSSAWTEDKRAYLYSAGAYKQSIHQVINVPVNNSNYEFEARVRMQYANPTTARAEISSYGGTLLTQNITNDGVWKYIKISNIYVTSGVIDVGFYIDSPGGTVLHVDDVRVRKQ